MLFRFLDHPQKVLYSLGLLFIGFVKTKCPGFKMLSSSHKSGFCLMARDSYFMNLVEVSTNHILAENIFTNHIE